jgi:hypothetical protein
MNEPSPFGAFRLASLLMAGLFIWFTVLQFNDVDAARWMVLYASAAVVSGLAAFRPSASGLPAAAVALAALVWAIIVAVPILGQPVAWGQVFSSMRMTGPHVEETREVLGLLIVAAWTTAVAVRGRSRSGAARATVLT